MNYLGKSAVKISPLSMQLSTRDVPVKIHLWCFSLGGCAD